MSPAVGRAAPLLIVSADDFGLSPGVCEGILRAHDRGVLTSTSALAVAPAFPSFASALRDSGLGVGVHLCAVGEDPPLLTRREVSTLVDDRGRFPTTWRSFVIRALQGRVDRDELRSELSCQIDAVRSSGATITHLDSHQHLHLWPRFSNVLISLAQEHGIAASRALMAHGWSPRSVTIRRLSRRFRIRAAAAGLALPDHSEGFDHAGAFDEPSMVTTVERLGRRQASSAELMTHPGESQDPGRRRYRWGYRWAEELDALCSVELRAAVDRSGFRLGTFGDLAEGPTM
jgi:predicted glycoside hydrolase/deacetylase ChbG (UPF0249 family)